MPKKKITTPTKKTATPAPAANTSPPVGATALPPAAQTVLTLLDTENGATAADLTERASLGRSTVTKALSTLRDAGLAVRQEGGFEGTRRIADRWLATPETAADADRDVAERQTPDAQPEPADDSDLAATADQDADSAENQNAEPEPAEEPADDETPATAPTVTAESDAADLSAHAETAHETAEPEAAEDGAGEPTADTTPDHEAAATAPTAEPDETDRAEADPEPESVQAATGDVADGTAAEHDGEPAQPTAELSPDGKSAADDEEPATVAADAEPSAQRLGKGELRARVEDHLREHPDRDWTPSAIAKILNRSAGAINNACEKLLEGKKVTTFDDKPRRFQWRTTEETDAA